MASRHQLSNLRGTLRMVIDATESIAGVVEKMHHTIQRGPLALGHASSGRLNGITGLVYRSVRGGIRLVGRGIDAGLAPVATPPPEGESMGATGTYRSVVNGIFGDYLSRTNNPLALGMSIRSGGQNIDTKTPITANKIALFVHGLCMNDTQWHRDGQNPGTELVVGLGYQPLHLHYNSGLNIANNGRELANILQTIVSNRESPFDEVVIIGHSMGGLVARSACHYGSKENHTWPIQLDKLFFLGTPHHGAPLERGGHVLDTLLELSRYSAPIATLSKSRSAGITDLRNGIITDENEHVPLPKRVKCYAAAAVRAEKRSVLSERLTGDGLVPVNSAMGLHRDPARTLAIAKKHQWIGYKMGHNELLHRPEVFAWIGKWL